MTRITRWRQLVPAISVPYISNVLQHDGLVDGVGGLWVGAEYGLRGGAGVAYPEKPYGYKELLNIVHGGTARAVATLLTLAEQGQLGEPGNELLNALSPLSAPNVWRTHDWDIITGLVRRCRGDQKWPPTGADFALF